MDRAISKTIEEYISKDYFRGVNILVGHGEESIQKSSYGYAVKFGKREEVLAEDSIFDIASLSKIFTTTAILRLVSQNVIDLDKRFVEYIDLEDERLITLISNITIRQLLNHSSGLIPWYPFYTSDRDFYSLLLDIVEKNPLTDKVQYSDLNFILLGKIIESVSDLELDRAIDELVIKPLGLGNTGYKPMGSTVAATEYGNQIEEGMVKERGLSFNDFRNKEYPIIGQVNDGNCYYYLNGISGHAGLFSNLEDLHKLCSLYKNWGLVKERVYIREDIIDESFKDYGGLRGLGWQLGDLYPGGVGHTGFTGTSIYIDLENNIDVVLLTNRLHVKKPVNIAEFRLAIHNIIRGKNK